MRMLHTMLAFALVTSVAGKANAQASGQPVDADTFRAQQDPTASVGQTDEQLHNLLQQTLGNPAAPANTGAPAPTIADPDSSTQASNVWLLGMGLTTCGEWLKTPGHGSEWMSGFWTGMNTLNSANHNVGKESGIDAVSADLKKRCTDHPDETLYDAASEIYVADMKGGK